MMTRRSFRPAWRAFTLTVLVICGSGLMSASAFGSASTPGPGWELTAHTFPTNLTPGKAGTVAIRVLNTGAAGSNGTVTVTDTLPPNVTATEAGSLEYFESSSGPHLSPLSDWDCAGNGPGGETHVEGASVVTCTNDPNNMPSVAGGGGGPNRDESRGRNGEYPYLDPEIAIAVNVSGAAKDPEEVVNRVAITGGGALTSASTEEPLTIGSKPAGFGFAGADAWFSNANGTIDTKAGSHPYEATFSFDLNNAPDTFPFFTSPDEERDLEFNLPPGFIGDPYAVATCTRERLNLEDCPLTSQIGVVTVEVIGTTMFRFPVYNMVPPVGEPAEFGFSLDGINTYLDTNVRSGSDYGLTTHVNNIAQRGILSSVLTLWGDPGDPSHNPWRTSESEGCVPGRGYPASECQPVAPDSVPFLTLPTSCVGPQAYSLSLNTWEAPGVEARTSFLTHDSDGSPVGFTGCEDLAFDPSIVAAPDTSNADTPAGLTVDVKPTLGGLLEPGGLGGTDIENTTVTLPEGVVINPGQAAGLGACQESEANVHVEGVAPTCPLNAKVGTDEIELPILKNALSGNVYVLQSEPPNLQLLITASGEGIEVKLVAHVHLDEKTGRLVTTLTGTPQAPVSDFRLSFSGGAQAALATPTACGTYETTADFTPWASPFVADALTTSVFTINHGTGAAPCPPSPLPFSPSLIAGSTTDQAGGFTDFSLLLQTADDQQRISKLQFKVPAGLSGMISTIPLCQEPQAAQGTCSSASQIGHTVVASGPGPYPLVVPQPGQPPAAIYLTGPTRLEGPNQSVAPFGLSIVVPVVVGPFVLQTQVVRAKIEVDPHTAQITVTTNPLPQIIDGVPTDLRTVNAVIDREGFMFNPTNCSPQEFSGTATSAQGTSVPISSHFQVGSCQSLKFAPDLKVATSGKTSKADGASLEAKIVYPTGVLGDNQATSQANIAKVKVDLPKQLPSRLTTLQKACTAAQFNANPAGCPAASVIGHATAITPELPVVGGASLQGPAYFVSNGGEAFPNLDIVLQGDNVTITLVADTFISKAGITSSTFNTVPDAPITSFDLTLPEGKYSALAANGNLCKSKLAMLTSFLGQNGAEIHQSTPITVTGCPKTKTLTRAQKLTKALKSCRKDKNKSKRARCEAAARKQYVVNTNAKGKKHAGGKKHG